MSNPSAQATEPETRPDASTGAAMPERDYANDYAVYWQARSGYFDRAPEGGRNSDPP
jgi:hypothetical protein